MVDELTLLKFIRILWRRIIQLVYFWYCLIMVLAA